MQYFTVPNYITYNYVEVNDDTVKNYGSAMVCKDNNKIALQLNHVSSYIYNSTIS